ncbi:MAG: hypothetical protein WC499_02490 [Patescibacteria group bacterium]
MYKYTYKNKKTGKVIYANEPIKGDDLILISQIKDGMIKSNNKKVVKK